MKIGITKKCVAFVVMTAMVLGLFGTAPLTGYAASGTHLQRAALGSSTWSDVPGWLDGTVESGFEPYSVSNGSLYTVNISTGAIHYRSLGGSDIVWHDLADWLYAPCGSIPAGYQPLGVADIYPFVINPSNGYIMRQTDDGTGSYNTDGIGFKFFASLSNNYSPLGVYQDQAAGCAAIVIKNDTTGQIQKRFMTEDGYGGDMGTFPELPAGYTYAGLGYDSGIIYMYAIGPVGPVIPAVTSSEATSVTSAGAALNGKVDSDGGAVITERGFVYSTTDNTPGVGEPGVTKQSVAGTTGVFNYSLTGLAPGTTYYVRAYAQNSVGTSYGSVISFTTNSLPTISDIANQTIDEDTPTGAISITVGDAETAAGSLTLEASSDNAALLQGGSFSFGGNGANRTLTITPIPNKYGTVNVTVTVRDGLGETAQKTFKLTVNSVNDKPTLVGFTMTANEDNEIVFTQNDFALNYNDIESDGMMKVKITGLPSNGTLMLGANPVNINDEVDTPNLGFLKYVPAANWSGTTSFTWQGFDGSAYSDNGAANIAINAVNDAPTDISLSAASINDIDTGTNAVVGTLSSTDPDSGNTFTYSLMPGTGDTGNASFNISGNSLRTNGALTAGSYSVRVRTTDNAGASYEKAFTINVVSIPTVVNVILPPNGTYKTGDIIGIIVQFSSAVNITGTPYIPVVLNKGGTASAYYVSGSGSSTLVFRYTVQEGEEDPDGITLQSPVILNGGTVQDSSAGTNAVLTFTPPSSAGIKVDGIAPALSVSGPSKPLASNGDVTYTVTYTGEDSITLTNADITLNKTGTAAGIINVSGTGSTRTVTISGITGDGTLGISIAAGTASDSAGNTTAGAGASATFTVDNTAPALSISAPSASVAASGGSITYTVTYSGADSITLADGDIILNKTGTANGTAAVSGTGSTRTVTISGITGDGTLGISIAAGTASDSAGNTTAGAGPSVTLTVDSTAPTGTVNINNGAGYMTTADVTLSITSSDGSGSGMGWMRFSVNGGSWSPWENINSTKTGSIPVLYGTVTIRMQLKDNAGNISAEISDDIIYKSVPSVSGTARNGTEDTTMNFSAADFIYSNADGATLKKIKIASLPTNGTLKLDNTNITASQEINAADLDRIIYIPDANWNGSNFFKWSAFDGTLWSEEATITITIAAVNDAPTAVAASVSTDVDTSVSGVLQANDADGDALIYEVVSQGIKGTLVVTNSNTGAFTYTPGEGNTGSDTVTFRVRDENLNSNTASINITIAPSKVADIGSLSISSGSISPSFASNILNYTASVSNSTSSITITAGVSSRYATLKIGGELVSVSGSVYQASKTINLNVGSNIVTLEVTAQDTTVKKTYTLTITRASAGSSANNNQGSSNQDTTGVEILVNGKAETAATAVTGKEGDKTVTTITIDDKKVDEKLQREGNNVVVTIPVKNNTDVVVGQLNGQTVKNMEAREAVLEIKTGNVTYTLPASQINIDSISQQIGHQVELKDIKVNVKISEPPKESVKIVEDTASKNSYQVVVKPVEFEITCSSGKNTIEVSTFNSYVQRMVAIPEGIDPRKITTGIVLNPEGTFSHVPTTIIVIGGKYWAKINSLTNSTYSVIWNPKIYKDVEKHWAKDEVNNIGSRLIMDGLGAGNFGPDIKITRGEFTDAIIRALGLLRTDKKTNQFKDVKEGNKYMASIAAAVEYGIIGGYKDGTFRPDRLVTREEAMNIMIGAMKVAGMDTAITDTEIKTILSKFKDSSKVNKIAVKAAAVCARNNLFVGGNGGNLVPSENITRAQAAAVIGRMLKNAKLI